MASMAHVEGLPVAHQSVRALLLMAFQTLGVIYSDIGTSPIYVMNGIFPSTLTEAPSDEDVIGSISCIIWLLTVIPLIKYAFIALRFGTGQGEGGPFALFSALYPGRDEEGDDIAAFTTHDTRTRTRTRDVNDEKFQEDRLNDLAGLHDSWLLRLIHKPFARLLLFGVAMFAIAATLSDGALTPAVSVVTAVEGLQVAQPNLTDSAIIGISVAFLVTLFAAQIVGTHRISFTFAPIVFCWMMLLAGEGIANITHAPQIWRAWDPSRLILWFVRTGDFTMLNGVLLCVTGSEAMFACLGQFTATSITLGFSFVVYPCIILAYLGQGARMISDGIDVLPNLFFLTIPGETGGGLYWVTLVFAILAAIIASQAMITASFSLLVQLMSYQCIPQLKAVRTSNSHRGQVFIPSALLFFCAASSGLVAGFGTGEGLTNAYGFAVASVFVCTSLFIALSYPTRGFKIFNKTILGAGAFILGGAFATWYLFVDMLLTVAAASKVPTGAYVPLGAAVIMIIFFAFYAWAKGLEITYAKVHRARLASLLAPYKMDEDNEDSSEALQLEDDDVTDHVVPVARSSAVNTVRIEGKAGVSYREVKPTAGTASEKFDSLAAPIYSPENTQHMMLRLVDKQEPLPRVPTVALFHAKSAGAAAPATFERYIRNFPALPTVVIFLTVKLTSDPHLDASQRYDVRKLRAASGFYRASAKFGYRDAIDLREIADPIVELITSIEARDNSETATETINAVRAAARSSITHILPSYEIVAAPSTLPIPIIRPVWSYLRKFLLESVYNVITLLFPEEQGYLYGTNGKVRVLVQAEL